MKQVIQDVRGRAVNVEDVPPPCCLPGGVLVQTAASLISSGTERAMIALAAKSLLGRARQRPDLVKKVYQSWRSVGLRETVSLTRARLNSAVPLGYSAAGIILESGAGVRDLAPGERVACAGAAYAAHAEINWVPQNLCALIPAGVELDEAASGAVGCVALQAVRVADVKLGERVAVIGLGLVGQLVCQILRAAGCIVWGIDPDPARVRLARELGAEFASESADGNSSPWQDAISRGQGMDTVIIAAGSRSSEPVDVAGRISRDRGVIVLTGDVRADLPREAYYRKELQVRYSRSYGPGRYDAAYEQEGLDYPYGFVRWTERRNLEAYLQLLAAGKVRLRPLITHRFNIGDAGKAYELLCGRRSEPHLGILLTCSSAAAPADRALFKERPPQAERTKAGVVRIGWIGAGTFARGKLLPIVSKMKNVDLVRLANATGISAWRSAREFGFRRCGADAGAVLDDPEIDAVFITARHHLHASLAQLALARGKHVFVEKPLCVNETELEELAQAYSKSRATLCAGFNRRFSPFARHCEGFFANRREPLKMIYRVRAGPLSPDHWVFRPEQGGGRIVGEICHFVDFAAFLAGSPERVQASRSPARPGNPEGDLHVQLSFSDGSSASIFYLSSGAASLPKERIEIFTEDKTAVCDDFRRGWFYSGTHCRSRWALRQDKGHRGELRAFLDAVRSGGKSPIPFASLYSVTLATFRIQESLRCGAALPVLLAARGASSSEKRRA